MAGHRLAPQPAFVLHQWDWSETSLILDLFTRDQGRIAAVAKGAKRPYSQLRPVLMPFQRLLVATSRPKAAPGEAPADILTLRSAEYAGAGGALPPGRLMSGFYLNELLLRGLARGDPHEALFDAYADAVQALAAAVDESPLRAFELLLLRELGLLPDLARCTTTQAALQPGAGYRLLPEAGLAPDDAEPALPGRTWLALQAALDRGGPQAALDRGGPQAALDRGGPQAAPALRQACAGALPALKAQLRAVLHYHLGTPPLRTRQMMLDLRRLIDTAAPVPATAEPDDPVPAAPPAGHPAPTADPPHPSPP